MKKLLLICIVALSLASGAYADPMPPPGQIEYLRGVTFTTACGFPPVATSGAYVALYDHYPANPPLPPGSIDQSYFAVSGPSNYRGYYYIFGVAGPTTAWAMAWTTVSYDPGTHTTRWTEPRQVTIPSRADFTIDVTPLDECNF